MPAPFSINIRHDVWKLKDTLDDLARKQIPFATAKTLTAVAVLGKGDVVQSMSERFDRPTPFTMNAVGMVPATKASQRAMIFVKDVQAKYLALDETGGSRQGVKGAPVVLPKGVNLNAYGNIPKGTLKRLGGRKGYFFGTVKGISGLWQRGPLGSIRLIADFKPKATYKPIFHYHQTVQARVRRDLPALLRVNLAKAIASALK